jgi:hypothetical protein
MTEQVPGYVVVLVFFMIVVTIATVGAFVAGFMVWLWTAWKQHKRDQGGEGEGGDGGGGGWTDKPGKGPNGGGPDRDIDRQFHAVADAIGKSINIEEKHGEKVLT